MTSTQSDNHVSAVLDLYDQIGVPAIEIDITGATPVVDKINKPFCREFAIEPTVCQNPAREVATSGDTPVEKIPHTPTVDGVELDIVEHDDVQYLRKRIWTRENLLELYHPAGKELPHHRHISVLHRVFRHNLRNGVSAICGWAKVIQEEAESNPQKAAEAAETVLKRANQLSQISEEAHRLEKLLHTGTELKERHIEPVVNQVIENCEEEFDNPTIVVDIGSDIVALTNDKLYFVIENLVDNAIRHNDDEVEVTIKTKEIGGDQIELIIEDDGCGLPPSEKQIISGGCDISQLSHGSGLGLWLVRWILDTYYATVKVKTANQEGTVFRISLHQ